MQVFDTCARKHRYDDIETGINSSPYFRNLLQSKSTTFLFPKLFTVIRPLIDTEGNETFSEVPFNETKSNFLLNSPFIVSMRLAQTPTKIRDMNFEVENLTCVKVPLF